MAAGRGPALAPGPSLLALGHRAGGDVAGVGSAGTHLGEVVEGARGAPWRPRPMPRAPAFVTAPGMR